MPYERRPRSEDALLDRDSENAMQRVNTQSRNDEDARVKAAVRKYMIEGLMWEGGNTDTDETRDFNAKVRAAVQKERNTPTSTVMQESRERSERNNELEIKRIYTSLMPEQWTSSFKTLKINEWLSAHPQPPNEMYKLLQADIRGTYWYDCNTLLPSCPLNPNNSKLAAESLTNFYQQVLPWAGVRVDWAHNTFDESSLSFASRLKRMSYLLRKKSFTVECDIVPNLPDPATFSYTALFAAVGAILIFAIVKT